MQSDYIKALTDLRSTMEKCVIIATTSVSDKPLVEAVNNSLEVTLDQLRPKVAVYRQQVYEIQASLDALLPSCILLLNTDRHSVEIASLVYKGYAELLYQHRATLRLITATIDWLEKSLLSLRYVPDTC